MRAIVSLRGPKHPAHRGGRADQSERTEVVRTYGKEINVIHKQNASEASILLKNFEMSSSTLCHIKSSIELSILHVLLT